MSANFEQISGPNGRVQQLTASSSVQTFIFNPKSLKGMLPGGDYVYATRMRARIYGQLVRAGSGTTPVPNQQQLAQVGRGVRVWSPFLGEVVNKTQSSVPLLANHDAYFANGFQNPIRELPRFAGSSGDTKWVVYEFPIYFKRRYLLEEEDSSIWLPLFEGGQVEIDLAPSNTFANMYATGSGWTMTGTWSCELVADWTPDRQALIHTPIQSRLYKVSTVGPEYTLVGVGSPGGLDGVVKGCRLPVLSWLGKGSSFALASGEEGVSFHDNGFYSAFGGNGGIYFGTNGSTGGDPDGASPNINRLDVPFRDQRSIDAVTAWLSSFLEETAAIRALPDITTAGIGATSDEAQNDLAQWPYARDPRLTNSSLIAAANGAIDYLNSGLDFFPLVWPSEVQKIVDAQKVDGDLSFTADLQDPPNSSILHLFRTDEICSFSAAKVMDIMERMGLKHQARGGNYVYVPKYSGLRAASESTRWGLPLKIIPADRGKGNDARR